MAAFGASPERARLSRQASQDRWRQDPCFVRSSHSSTGPQGPGVGPDSSWRNIPLQSVVAYAKSRIAQSQISMELGLELLWLFERTKDFSQLDLFRRVARSPNVVVRRAAARSLRWWAPSLQAEALAIAAELLNSGDARTKISLISAASHLRRTDSAWWGPGQGH